MIEEEMNKLRTRSQLAEDNNRILAQKLKDKDKYIKTINALFQKEKSKLGEIYKVVSSNKINETNYMKMIDWIKKVIKEEI